MTHDTDQSRAWLINARFRWTLDEYFSATKATLKERSLLQKTMPYLVVVFFAVVIAANTGFAHAFVSGLIGVVFWTCFIRAIRDKERREFKRFPACDCETEWSIDEVRIQNSTGSRQSAFGWDWVTHAIQTPNGFLLTIGGEAAWLPNHGFSSQLEIERLCQLLHDKVKTFKPKRRKLT
jgi:hypothetical protein